MVSSALSYSLSARSNSLERMLTCSSVTDIPVLSFPLLQLVIRRPGDCFLNLKVITAIMRLLMETNNKLFSFSSQSVYVNFFYFVFCMLGLAVAGEYTVSNLYFVVKRTLNTTNTTHHSVWDISGMKGRECQHSCFSYCQLRSSRWTKGLQLKLHRFQMKIVLKEIVVWHGRILGWKLTDIMIFVFPPLRTYCFLIPCGCRLGSVWLNLEAPKIM